MTTSNKFRNLEYNTKCLGLMYRGKGAESTLHEKLFIMIYSNKTKTRKFLLRLVIGLKVGTVKWPCTRGKRAGKLNLPQDCTTMLMEESGEARRQLEEEEEIFFNRKTCFSSSAR
uniref:Uncharacterized protein n=1 Tax=Glossina austeni TaxID=7395 RepID=A0A1A9VFG7_GLOAU